MKRNLSIAALALTLSLFAFSAFAQWNPRVILEVTQCQLADGSIVAIANNAQIGPGVAVERLDEWTNRVYFASDDIPTVLSPGQYDIYFVDVYLPTMTCGIARSIDFICDFPLNTSKHDEQPRVSPDRQYLVYAQVGPGGEHDHEIWIAEKNTNGLWSNPRKLPSLVNSGHDEHSGSYRDGKLYFSARNRDGSNCGFDMWACDYDPSANTAANLEKIVFGSCYVPPPPPDTTSLHDPLSINSHPDFQWYSSSVSWNAANDGYIAGITSSWYEAIISGVPFDPQDMPSVTFRIYRGTSSNHMGGFTDTPGTVSNFHYNNIDIGIYIHSKGSIRPTWDVNNTSYWSKTIPEGYYDVRVALDPVNGTASFAIEQVASWDAPLSDFNSPYWSRTEYRSIGGPYYVQINPYNTVSYVYDVWSGPAGASSPAPPSSFAWDEADPWITPDGQGMVFQTYGAPGSSGHDIMYSERIECEEGGYMWSQPVLLDANVNGTGHETNPTLTDDLRFLFFSSNSTPAPTYRIMYCTKFMSVASIAGRVTDITTGNPAYGVTVALYREENGEHLFVDDDITGTDGSYGFSDLDAGSYVVEIVIPVGFLADVSSRDVVLEGSDALGIDFEIYTLIATNESRGLGYWKHQVNVVLTGKGKLHEDESDVETSFPQAIFDHFFSHATEAIQIQGVTFSLVDGAPAPLSVEEMQKTLSAGKGITSLDKAKMHYLVLLLNVVSNKVGQQVVISEDGANVSQAITRIRDLIASGAEAALSSAKTIAESINEGILVPAGLIPTGTPVIYYTGERPTRVVLNQNWPNPFNPTTTIGFTLEKAGYHELAVYDISGAVVKVLSRGPLCAGTHTVQWDGTNSRGQKVATGMYFYRLKSSGAVHKNKMVLLR